MALHRVLADAETLASLEEQPSDARVERMALLEAALLPFVLARESDDGSEKEPPVAVQVAGQTHGEDPWDFAVKALREPASPSQPSVPEARGDGPAPGLDATEAQDDPVDRGIGSSASARVAEMLREFHDTFGGPGTKTDDLWLRGTLHREECDELISALQEWVGALGKVRIRRGDKFPATQDAIRMAVARELADVVYVAYGTALIADLDLDAALAEVHRANMSKLGADGKPILRDDGKRRPITVGEQHIHRCGTCGSPVRVVGRTTKHYEPAEALTAYRCPVHGLRSTALAGHRCDYFVTNAQCRLPVEPVVMVPLRNEGGDNRG